MVYTRLCSKNRTQWHTRRNRGLPSLDHSAALCRQRNTLYFATLLYTYISRFSVNPQHQQKRKIWQSCCHKFYPPTVFHPAFQLLAQMAHVCFHGRKRVHTRLSEKDRTQRLTRRNTGRFGWGTLLLPSERSARSQTSPGRVSERQTLPLLCLGREALLKDTESLRNSDALMRVAVPQASRPRWAA